MRLKLLIIAFLLIGTVIAEAPEGPHQFYGYASVNGKPIDNNLVIAKINSTEVSATVTISGTYGYRPSIFVVPDPNSDREEKTIEFFFRDMNGIEIKAGEYVFKNFGTTNLDLSGTGNFCGDSICQETCSSCSRDCGSCPPSGNGNNGNNNPPPSAPDIEKPSMQPVCTPDWQCTEWMECFNNKQRRVCIDANKCNSTDKPEELQNCTSSLCGNKICEQGEDCTSCKEDCSCQDGTMIIALFMAMIVIILILVYQFFVLGK